MKHKYSRFLPLASIICIAIIILSNSGGPSGDNTGSPNDSNQDACTQCHSTFGLNSGTGQVSATVPSSYYPGGSYQITIQVSQPSPSAARYGFQAVALNNSNQQAGTYTAGTGTSINTSGIDNITHNSTVNTSGSWTFTWNAPTTPEPVTLYYSGNAANGNFGTSGDYIYTNSSSITALPLISFTKDSTDATCANSCDGAASFLNVSGGSGGPYSFDWSNNGSGPSQSNLCAGTYTVTISDANGNEEITQVTIDAPPPFQTQINSNPASCGQNDGDAIVTVQGGVGPYTYLWSDPQSQTGDNAMNLSAGTYTVTITDANGCTTTETTFVPTGSSGITILLDPKDENCGQMDGSAQTIIFGGVAPLNFLWSDGSSQQNLSGVSAGSYTLTVTDDSGCVELENVIIDESDAEIDEPNSTITSSLCFGSNTGSIMVTMADGVAPFTYAWQDLPQDSNASISSLFAGSYTVTVTDSAGCTDQATFTVTEPDEISIADTIISQPSDPNICDASASVTVTGGVAPYEYLWSDPTSQNQSTATGLCNIVNYTVTVTDDNGCQRVSDTITPFFPGGIESLESSLISVYPNPASGSVRIETDQNQLKSIVILDFQGRTVLKLSELNDQSIEVDLSDIPQGSYFIQIESSKGLAKQSLIIQ